MKPKTLAEIYLETGKASCFRIRDTETLEDWATGSVHDWVWNYEAPERVPSDVKAVKVETAGISMVHLSATVAKYALLSTEAEIRYLKHLPPFGAFQFIREAYMMASRKAEVEVSLTHLNRADSIQKSYINNLLKHSAVHGGYPVRYDCRS